MDAHVMRGGAPAARGEDASQEQDRVEQDGDMHCDQEPSDDIEPVVTNSGGHNGYLLCSQNPTRPAAEFGGFALDAEGSCELLSGEHKGERVWCFSDGSGPTQAIQWTAALDFGAAWKYLQDHHLPSPTR